VEPQTTKEFAQPTNNAENFVVKDKEAI